MCTGASVLHKQHSLVVWCVLVAAHSVYSTTTSLPGVCLPRWLGLEIRSLHCCTAVAIAKFVDRQRVQRHSLLSACAASSLSRAPYIPDVFVFWTPGATKKDTTTD